MGCFCALALKQVYVKGADKTSDQRNQTHDQLGGKISPRWRRIPFRYCGSEFLNPLFFINVAIEAGLNCRLQCTLIAFGQDNEPERLLCAGDRHEHFCCTQHRSPVCVKHQLNDMPSVCELE
jgi:hypothetical protein